MALPPLSGDGHDFAIPPGLMARQANFDALLFQTARHQAEKTPPVKRFLARYRNPYTDKPEAEGGLDPDGRQHHPDLGMAGRLLLAKGRWGRPYQVDPPQTLGKTIGPMTLVGKVEI